MRGRIVLLPLLLLTISAGGVSAEPMSYFLKNDHARAVVLELDGAETGTRWPGGDQVWLLDPGARKTVTIECRKGERICYGAWVNGDDSRAWGVGPDGDRPCEECCVACGSRKTANVTIE